MNKRSILHIFLLFLFAFINSDVRAQAHPEAGAKVVNDSTIYVIPAYDPARNPSDDLKHAVEKVKPTGKRILLEVGGEWCSWCHALDRFIHQNKKVAETLREDFVIVKVNFSEENENKEFLSQYPEIPGYPHVFVLDSDGKFLHSQGTGDLEEGKSYSEKAWLDFLGKWSTPD